MKLLNWIKNLFKKESPKAEAPKNDISRDLTPSNPSETPSSSNSSTSFDMLMYQGIPQ